MGRAQVSIEYMIITAFAFLFILPIIALFYSQSHGLNEDLTSSQVERVAAEIVDAANEVFYLGEPSKKTLLLYMPKNVKSISIQGEHISIIISTRAGDTDIAKYASTNLTGSLGTFSGLHRVVVEAGIQQVTISE